MPFGVDILILGGGTAGCVLAAELSANSDVSVLLVERGQDVRALPSMPPELAAPYGPAVFASPHLRRYATRLTPASPVGADSLRGGLLGGSGAVNGAMFLRGTPEDYDSWGSTLWRFESVLPTFMALESDVDCDPAFHGHDGPIPVIHHRSGSWLPYQAAFVEAGLSTGFEYCPDQNDPRASGAGPLPFNEAIGRRAGMDVTHLAPARARDNLTVWTEAAAERLLIDGDRVVGAEVVVAGERRTVRADLVVLSAGAIETPAILFRSGIGSPEDLKAAGRKAVVAMPGVGASLQDHPMVVLEAIAARPVNPGAARHQTAITYTSSDAIGRRDMQLLPSHNVGSDGSDTVRIMVNLQLPVSRGRLMAQTHGDAPLVELGYLTDQVDVRRLVEGLVLTRDILETMRAAGQVGDTFDQPDWRSAEAINRWIKDNVRTAQHGTSTCSMSARTHDLRVVDERCRVVGLDGLRIADLSIAPSVPSAGTNSTAAMIGARVAALIGEDLGWSRQA